MSTGNTAVAAAQVAVADAQTTLDNVTALSNDDAGLREILQGILTAQVAVLTALSTQEG